MRISERIPLVKIAKLTYALIFLLLILNFIVLMGLPWLIKNIILIEIGSGYRSLDVNKSMYYYFLSVLYIAGILAAIILNDLRLIFKSCILENIFVKETISRLLRLAITTGLIALVFLTKLFIVNSIMTMVVVFVFFMASVFCLVLALLFDQALHYKEENDLTI